MLNLAAPLAVAATLLSSSVSAASQSGTSSTWVRPGSRPGLPAGHNGDTLERLVRPSAGKQPHVLLVLFDDYGWADAGWHRNYTAPGGEHVPASPDVLTPNLNALVEEGINLDRNYVYK